MANAATIAFFGAWAPDDFAKTLFADGVPLAAGQFAPNGVAVPKETATASRATTTSVAESGTPRGSAPAC